MSSDFFASTMEDLYSLFGKEIPSEISNSVYFTLESGLKIAFEMRDDPHGLFMAVELGSLPRSASRVLWVQEALRWNGDVEAESQIGFNKSQDLLVGFKLFSLLFLNAQIIYEAIPAFQEKALIWKNAINNGYPPTLPGASKMEMESNTPFRAGSAPVGFIGRTIRP